MIKAIKRLFFEREECADAILREFIRRPDADIIFESRESRILERDKRVFKKVQEKMVNHVLSNTLPFSGLKIKAEEIEKIEMQRNGSGRLWFGTQYSMADVI